MREGQATVSRAGIEENGFCTVAARTGNHREEEERTGAARTGAAAKNIPSVAARKKPKTPLRKPKKPLLKSLQIIAEKVQSGCKKADFSLKLLLCGLSLFGLVAVYAASSYTARKTYGDAFYFVKKQAFGVAIGWVLLAFFSRVDYRKLQKFAYPLVAVTYILLALVFVPGISKESYGAKRWIGLFGVTVQPSELAKFAFVLFFATYAAKNPGRIGTFRGILPPLFVCAGYLLLILLEPNLSVTICFAAVCFLLLFAGGAKKRHLGLLILPAAAAVPVLIAAEPYRLKRLAAFLDPWAAPKGEGYQLLQSLYAVGSGGWFGVGLFCSRQKYKFLSFAESDFILAVIAEELGFFGVLLLFSALAAVVFLGFRAAKKSPDFVGYLLAFGVTAVFFVQCAVNALVVTGTIPPTGIPLPFISSGNTALAAFFAAFGVLCNVTRQGDKY